jgi:hypothetical protein
MTKALLLKIGKLGKVDSYMAAATAIEAAQL